MQNALMTLMHASFVPIEREANAFLILIITCYSCCAIITHFSGVALNTRFVRRSPDLVDKTPNTLAIATASVLAYALIKNQRVASHPLDNPACFERAASGQFASGVAMPNSLGWFSNPIALTLAQSQQPPKLVSSNRQLVDFNLEWSERVAERICEGAGDRTWNAFSDSA
jgi:hypothetical protein